MLVDPSLWRPCSACEIDGDEGSFARKVPVNGAVFPAAMFAFQIILELDRNGIRERLDRYKEYFNLIESLRRDERLV